MIKSGKGVGKELISCSAGRRVNRYTFLEEQIWNIYQNFNCAYLTPAISRGIFYRNTPVFSQRGKGKDGHCGMFTTLKKQKQAKCPCIKEHLNKLSHTYYGVLCCKRIRKHIGITVLISPRYTILQPLKKWCSTTYSKMFTIITIINYLLVTYIKFIRLI